MAVSEKQCCHAHKLTPSSTSEKWDLLWRLIHYKKPSRGVWSPKCKVSNQCFQQIPPKHSKLDWALNMQRSARCLQLVNVLPLISTTTSSSSSLSLSCLSLLSLYLFSPCLCPLGEEFEVAFLELCFLNGLVLLCLVSGLWQGLDAELKPNLMLRSPQEVVLGILLVAAGRFILDSTGSLLRAMASHHGNMVCCLPIPPLV